MTRKLLLFQFLIITLSALCQTHPKLNTTQLTPDSIKTKRIFSEQSPSNQITKNTENKVYTSKKPAKNLKCTKLTDHSFDRVNEPE